MFLVPVLFFFPFQGQAEVYRTDNAINLGGSLNFSFVIGKDDYAGLFPLRLDHVWRRGIGEHCLVSFGPFVDFGLSVPPHAQLMEIDVFAGAGGRAQILWGKNLGVQDEDPWGFGAGFEASIGFGYDAFEDALVYPGVCGVVELNWKSVVFDLQIGNLLFEDGNLSRKLAGIVNPVGVGFRLGVQW